MVGPGGRRGVPGPDGLPGVAWPDGLPSGPADHGPRPGAKGRQPRHAAHRSSRWNAGGGIGLQYCTVTDDGVRCALEYNCVRWGSHDLPPQAGIGVFERGADGLLAAARVYDDVEAPVGRP